jgi:hypothetical protein
MLGAVTTAKDKLARMAEGLARLNRESAQRAASATPGQSIERALELSVLVGRSATNFEKPLPPSLPALWRARQAGRR